MSFVRPEVRAALVQWREVLIALAAAGFGLWVAFRGGYFFGILGALVTAFALGLALAAWRRMRFDRGADDPGLVQIDEGQIAYFGPEAGGLAALSELSRIELVAADGRQAWRLIQADGRRLTIPTAARGADALFDTFAALPGAAPHIFLAALSAPSPSGDGVRRVWQHPDHPLDPALSAPRPNP